jgi:hypothetical protein
LNDAPDLIVQGGELALNGPRKTDLRPYSGHKQCSEVRNDREKVFLHLLSDQRKRDKAEVAR